MLERRAQRERAPRLVQRNTSTGPRQPARPEHRLQPADHFRSTTLTLPGSTTANPPTGRPPNFCDGLYHTGGESSPSAARTADEDDTLTRPGTEEDQLTKVLVFGDEHSILSCGNCGHLCIGGARRVFGNRSCVVAGHTESAYDAEVAALVRQKTHRRYPPWTVIVSRTADSSCASESAA